MRRRSTDLCIALILMSFGTLTACEPPRPQRTFPPDSTTHPSEDPSPSPGISPHPLEPYAEVLRQLLVQPVHSGGPLALAETEVPLEGDAWFWSDDSGKALELLSLPGLAARHERTVDALSRFILDTSPAPFVFRRKVAPRRTLSDASSPDIGLVTGMYNFAGDLSQGRLRQSFRFHDGRTVDAVDHTGAFITLRVDGDPTLHAVDLEDAITSWGVEPEEDGVRLFWRSSLVIGGAERGHVEHVWSVGDAEAVLRLDVTVHAAVGTTLRDVHLATSVDQLDTLAGSVRYDTFFCKGDGCDLTEVRASGAHDRTVAGSGVRWWWLVPRGDPSFGHAVLVQPMQHDRVHRIASTDEGVTAFHRVFTEYAVGDVLAHAPVTFTEQRLLVAGGLYDDPDAYDTLVTEGLAGRGGIDLSVSYDYGAELNGMVAAHHAAVAAGQADVERRAWIDDMLHAYERHFLPTHREGVERTFSRGLSFVVLALDGMYRTTGEPRYRAALIRHADALLGFETDATFRCWGGFLDCHGAAQIALGRAALTTRDVRYAEAVRRGITALRLDLTAPLHERLWTQSSADNRDAQLWAFKSGLVLRAMRVTTLLEQEGLLTLSEAERAYRTAVEAVAADYIHSCTREREDGMLEVLTSFASAETNSETQPWAALAFSDVDAEWLRRAPPQP